MMVQTLPGRPWLQAAQCLCTLHFACSVECFSDTNVGKLGTKLLTQASASSSCSLSGSPTYRSMETTSRSLSLTPQCCGPGPATWPFPSLSPRRPPPGKALHRGTSWSPWLPRQRWTYVCLGAVGEVAVGWAPGTWVWDTGHVGPGLASTRGHGLHGEETVGCFVPRFWHKTFLLSRRGFSEFFSSFSQTVVQNRRPQWSCRSRWRSSPPLPGASASSGTSTTTCATRPAISPGTTWGWRMTLWTGEPITPALSFPGQAGVGRRVTRGRHVRLPMWPPRFTASISACPCWVCAAQLAACWPFTSVPPLKWYFGALYKTCLWLYLLVVFSPCLCYVGNFPLSLLYMQPRASWSERLAFVPVDQPTGQWSCSFGSEPRGHVAFNPWKD